MARPDATCEARISNWQDIGRLIRPRPAGQSHYAPSTLAGEAIARSSTAGQASRSWPRASPTSCANDCARVPVPTGRSEGSPRNLYGYVDARDVAQVARTALTADVDGTPAYLVAAADTCRPQLTPTARRGVPEVEIRGDLSGHTTLVSINRARAELGHEPAHSWRNHVRA